MVAELHVSGQVTLLPSLVFAKRGCMANPQDLSVNVTSDDGCACPNLVLETIGHVLQILFVVLFHILVDHLTTPSCRTKECTTDYYLRSISLFERKGAK